MENTLLNYMNKRVTEHVQKTDAGQGVVGPVITISREVGCGGVLLGRKLAQELNKSVFCKHWEVVSKEVLRASSRELKLSPEKVNRLFSTREHSSFEEILSAFTDKYYKSNRVILKTVKDVIRNFAIDGCCIIVGRAGHVIASDVENSLHLRLIAPLEWRIHSISIRKNMSKADALKYIQETEKERDAFRKHFVKDKSQEEIFDLTIDVSRFPTDKILSLLLIAFEYKGIPANIKQKVPYF